ncbi:MAG: alpha amylase C-terminal domain-containing protein [Rhodospirillales bacterium]
MLYLDYSRPAYGGWIPNVYGGKENLEAIEFLKHTNSILHARYPGILMIAEESTSWPNVSRPTDQGGLGFGFKWNMGWMHDTLAYFSVPPADRKWHHGRLTFSIVYAFNENFVLSLSHDEVVHLKRSLLGKMPGEEWERFANLRLLFTLMYAHPGKKLLFMGGELGQEHEWSHETGLEWRALERRPNRALGWCVQDLNRLYRSQPALHQVDFRAQGFEWLEVENADESILAFLRKAKDPRQALIFAGNFSAISRPDHRIGVPYPVAYTVLFGNQAQVRRRRHCAWRARRIIAEDVPWPRPRRSPAQPACRRCRRSCSPTLRPARLTPLRLTCAGIRPLDARCRSAPSRPPWPDQYPGRQTLMGREPGDPGAAAAIGGSDLRQFSPAGNGAAVASVPRHAPGGQAENACSHPASGESSRRRAGSRGLASRR